VVINKAKVLIIVILVLALATIMYLVFITRSRNQSIERYSRAYTEIKVGDSRDTVVAAMGKPSEITNCPYTPFNDPKQEAEFRAKCFQRYRYILLLREYTFSFDQNGAVIAKSSAISP
jgi:hypothetical protein